MNPQSDSISWDAALEYNIAAVDEDDREGQMPTWLWPKKPVAATLYCPETNAHQVFHRIAGHWAYAAWIYGYVDAQEDAWKLYSAAYLGLAKQYFAPNSPQWFNTGVWWAYGTRRSRAGLSMAALGNDHFILQVASLTRQLGAWKGTATELRDQILYLLGQDEPGDARVPASPSTVGATLRRFLTALRAEGIDVMLDDCDPGTGRRRIKLRAID